MKINKIIVIAFAAATAVVGAISANAVEPLKGEAGRDVVWTYSNGCNTFRNLSNRRIHLTLGNWSMDLQATETKTFIGFGGKCQESWVGENSASYLDPQ